MLGQFEVTVETSKGYFVATFPDTEAGVTQFLQAIRPALEREPGRFYPCVAYDGPSRKVCSPKESASHRTLEPASETRGSPTLLGLFAMTGSPRISQAILRRS